MADSQFVTDVNEQNFETVVGMAPQDTVILLDFWAPWCAPCKALTPVLERVVDQYAGRVMLAKINVDENPRLAAGFQIQGIPNVKVIQNAQLVDEFTGAIPEEQITAMLDRLVPMETEAETDEVSDDPLSNGQRLLSEGKTAEAKALFESLLQGEERNPGAHLWLAKVAIAEGDMEEAERQAGMVEIGDPEYDEARGILATMEFQARCQASPGLETLRQTVQNEPENYDALFDYACCLATQHAHEEALECLLTILKKKYNYKNGAARDAMLKIFSIIGARDPISDHYRSQMQIYL